jgi:hypothetical protein
MKKVLLFVLLAFLLGCDCNPPAIMPAYTVQGTVRSVWCSYTCAIVFEHDSGETSTIVVEGHPPVWQGEHCSITLRKNCVNCSRDNIISSRRIQ